jgi:hypothetical protein
MMLPRKLLPLSMIILMKDAEVSPFFSICSCGNIWGTHQTLSFMSRRYFENGKKGANELPRAEARLGGNFGSLL